ncbi:hypothetical protein [Abyssibius alkaniclasticus]|uniref:hypothetical protein n=1 Tax=Abyssibius alkaniclasticus TaxID=2881234 RepID=UPI004058DE6A
MRYLALGGCDKLRPPEKGVRIAGALIYGDGPDGAETKGLDLEGASLPSDLWLFDCRFDDKAVLRSCKGNNFGFSGSHLPQGISADGLVARGGVFMQGTKATGEVRMLGAQLGGDLDCDNAQFEAAQGSDGAWGDAFSADRLVAQGSVFMRGTNATGEVRMLGAQLGGSLACNNAQFTAVQGSDGAWGDAFSADGLVAQGGVFMRGTKATGVVRMLGAQLGGDLACNNAQFTARGGEVAFHLQGVVSKGILFWRSIAGLEGILSLDHAKFAAICDDEASWPKAGMLDLDQCQYGSFAGAPVSAEARLKWLALQKPKGGVSFLPQPYEQCAKVLREMGHGVEARTILIEKERLQREARRAELPKLVWPIWWLKDQALNLSVRYGRRPLLAFAWLALFWAMGAIWFGEVAKEGALKPNNAFILRSPEWVRCGYSVGELRQPSGNPQMISGLARGAQSQMDCFLNRDEARNYPRFNPLIYAADTLLPIVDLELQNYWIPDETKPYGQWARYYLWFQIFAGWGLSLLAVAGFSGLIKTDNTT